MTALLLQGQLRSGIRCKAGRIRQCLRRKEAVNLCEVTKCRSRKCIGIVRGPGDLAGVERNRHLVLHRLMEGLRQKVVLTPLRIGGREEP